MAKKIRKASGRKKGRKSTRVSSLKRIVKHFLIGCSVVIAVAVASLFTYSYLFPSQKEVPTEDQAPLPEPKREAVSPIATPSKKSKPGNTTSDKAPTKAKTPTALPTPAPASKLSKLPQGAEIPQLTSKRREQVIRHEGYTVSYNSDFVVANWVAYELTLDEAKSKKADRSNKFVPDPLVKGASATNEDYTRTGYDRGHLAPAGDMKWSAKAMRESFYLSNICPQKPALNRGIWKDLEEQCRLWALNELSILVVTGPVLTDNLNRMGKNRVAVPDQFYKVICTIIDGEPQAIGFLFENRDYKKESLPTFAIPIDSVERVTGIDFFPALPDDVERRMEAKVNHDKWSF